MSFQVRTELRPAGSRDGTVYLLEDRTGGSRAVLWPALGFNCFEWQETCDGTSHDLLYADPQLFSDGRPTRSGIPILFPFPNRIRNGCFHWEGKAYSLPLTDSTGTHAIHGFACRKPWRVIDQGASENEAWITGEFHGAVDAPESLASWPSDYALRVTYRLSAGRLRLEAVVHNPDAKPLPFGLGYHPYFRLFNGDAERCQVQVPAQNYWELKDYLPIGERRPVDAARDLNLPRPVSALHLDDVLTDLPAGQQDRHAPLYDRAAFSGERSRMQLRLSCSSAFREMVVFTPAHRQAFCVEPYTCVTDAVNLEAQGIDAGWLTLQPGATWSATVELACTRG